MSKQVRIRVNYGKTFNLGNYESERIDISLEKDVDLKDWVLETSSLFVELKIQVDQLRKFG